MTFFDAAYEGTPPWDIGGRRPRSSGWPRPTRSPGSVLDVGCGTGENALCLAARGHDVLGVDAAPVAIERATAKARDRGVEAEFVAWDARRVAEFDRTFDTGIDVGLFHSFQDEERPVFAHNLHAVLEPGGRRA
jgi:cyclopropane fatty-acyl-phospholipid synthase-like methyltransferase